MPDRYKVFKCNDGSEDAFLLADNGTRTNRILTLEEDVVV